MKKIRLRRIGLRKILRRVATNYLDHHVGKNAAALAYYMLFALFPLLIFCSNLLGLLDLNVHAIEPHGRSAVELDHGNSAVANRSGNRRVFIRQHSH